MRMCMIVGCDKVHWAHGLCQMHYQRMRHHGTTDLMYRTADWPLVCVCDIPQPTPTDMCSTCLRVIADLVWARRSARLREAS